MIILSTFVIEGNNSGENVPVAAQNYNFSRASLMSVKMLK